RQLGFTLGRNLAHQDVAGLDLGADADDAFLVQVLQRLVADVGNVARDLLRAQLGVAGLDFVLLDVDRAELVLADDPLGEDDRVLVVDALPAHEGADHALAQGQLAAVRRRAVDQAGALRDAVALADVRPLVEAGSRVRADELEDRVGDLFTVVVAHADAT